MLHEVLSDLDVLVELDEQEGQRLVDHRSELVPVHTEVVQ